MELDGGVFSEELTKEKRAHNLGPSWKSLD